MTTQNEILTVKQWLERDCRCFDVRPCIVEIAGERWENAAQYSQTFTYTEGMDCVRDGRKKAGDTYTETRIYVVGNLPKVKHPKNRKYPIDGVCFPYREQDWYVACYISADRLKGFEHAHPLGANFILCPWDIPNSKIDDGEPKPYKRFLMIVRFL